MLPLESATYELYSRRCSYKVVTPTIALRLDSAFAPSRAISAVESGAAHGPRFTSHGSPATFLFCYSAGALQCVIFAGFSAY